MMSYEDEEFNRIEMESRIKQEYIRNMKTQSVAMPDYLKLMEELAFARVLIRELGDRLAKLEKPLVGRTKMNEEFDALFAEHQKLLSELQAMRNVKRTWVGLTDEEREFLLHQGLRFYDTNARLLSFIKTVEAKLKEKNCAS